jgi:hypothetical protein
MSKHAQLTVNQLRGPMNQLLTNLQGENGHEWLTAFNLFLRKEPVWIQEPTTPAVPGTPTGIHDLEELPQEFAQIFTEDTNLLLCIRWADEDKNEVRVSIEVRAHGGNWDDVVKIEFDDCIPSDVVIEALDSDLCWKTMRKLVSSGDDIKSAQLEGVLSALLSDWYDIHCRVSTDLTQFILTPGEDDAEIIATIETAKIQPFLKPKSKKRVNVKPR